MSPALRVVMQPARRNPDTGEWRQVGIPMDVQLSTEELHGVRELLGFEPGGEHHGRFGKEMEISRILTFIGHCIQVSYFYPSILKKLTSPVNVENDIDADFGKRN